MQNNVKKQPWGKWEFSPQLRDALEKFEKTCLETEPLPEEYASNIPPVYCKEKPQNSGLEEMDIDVIEESSHQAVTVPDIQPSQMSQSSQSLAAQDVIQALEDGKLNPECLNEIPKNKIKKFLPLLSDCALLNMSEIVCKLRNGELAVIMCTDVFLPWLSDTTRSCSRSILEAMKQLTSTYPAEVSTHLLGPLIIGTVDHQQILSPIIVTLAPEHKISVIRAVVESGPMQLTEWQATLLQVAIVPSTDEILNEKIITLLLKSGSGLSSSAKFGQLLITVIQKIGPSLSINKREYLAAVLAEHKTVARKIGEKALKALN
ncbi:uncharacterized protein LOC126148860 isoform X1 [Schistocerca cancellata]|uniref:uncharacterized protein LOC126148860 isoform X1 n=2 Tax=Schistocerca cancellata TaxID=274614 RepID=UPI0021194636|nr:uncharacterized protein LOC126148860 isoform X1 [Schistocerca cancellata]